MKFNQSHSIHRRPRQFHEINKTTMKRQSIYIPNRQIYRRQIYREPQICQRYPYNLTVVIVNQYDIRRFRPRICKRWSEDPSRQNGYLTYQYRISYWNERNEIWTHQCRNLFGKTIDVISLKNY